jgi:hypothetical protein
VSRSCLQKRDPAPVQAAFAAVYLCVIAAGVGFNFARGALEPGFAAIGAAIIAAMALMIGEIEPIRVGEGDAGLFTAFVRIPADEIDRIAEIIPVRAASAGVVAIPVPGAVQRLGVAVGGGGAASRDET